jgi:hypothetical protein
LGQSAVDLRHIAGAAKATIVFGLALLIPAE